MKPADPHQINYMWTQIKKHNRGGSRPRVKQRGDTGWQRGILGHDLLLFRFQWIWAALEREDSLIGRGLAERCFLGLRGAACFMYSSYLHLLSTPVPSELTRHHSTPQTRLVLEDEPQTNQVHSAFPSGFISLKAPGRNFTYFSMGLYPGS